MKPQNQSAIIEKYLWFLGYLTVLFSLTMAYFYFYHQTCKAYSNVLIQKKNQMDLIITERSNLCQKIDSINFFLKLLNTDKVANEVALERTIIRLKNEASKKISDLEKTSEGQFKLYKTIIFNVEMALENKKRYQQTKAEEENQRQKLLECIEANKKARKGFTN